MKIRAAFEGADTDGMPLSSDEETKRERQAFAVGGLAVVLMAFASASWTLGWPWTVWASCEAAAVAALFGSMGLWVWWGSRERELPPMRWWREQVNDTKREIGENWRRGLIPRARLAVQMPIVVIVLGMQWIVARSFLLWRRRASS